MMELSKRELSSRVTLIAMQTDKFKTSMLGFTFLEPLSQKTVSENAILPALLRRGTQKHPDMLSMAAALDDLYGGAIEPMVRKKGETQCIGFIGSFLDEAYVHKEASVLESAIALMADLLLSPAGSGNGFVEAYLESEKGNLINRIRSRINDKQQYALYRLTKEMCQNEAYGMDKLGEEAQVNAITNASLWERYQTLLKTAPMLVYYCGSAPVERVETALRSTLAPLLSGEKAQAQAKTEYKAAGKQEPRYFKDNMDVMQGKLVMGFRLDRPYTAPKDAAVLQVFNAMYGGSTNAKLFLNVRERLSLCYYANSSVDKQKGILFVSSGIAFDQYEKAKDEILAQLDDCRKGKISDEELESARSFVTNNLRLTEDSQGRLEDFWLGQSVADCDDEPAAIRTAVEAVTKEEVQNVAKELWLDSVYFLQGKEARTP